MEHPASAPPRTRHDRRESHDSPDLDRVRRSLAASLPAALHAAMAAYHDFVATGVPGDPKAFAAYHAGCRAALAHAESLVKLIRWIEAGGTGTAGMANDSAAGLIAEARAALQDLSNRG